MKRLILVVTFILAAIGALLAVFAPVFTPDTEASTSNTYRVGMVEDVTTLNVWKYLATDQSVFNSYVIDGLHPSLYRLSDQRFDWVPYLADGFPTAFQQESVATTTFWTSQITLKQGVLWSDGSQFDANDVVFTIETIVDFQLSGNWSTLLDRNVFDHAEVVDSRTVKMYFKQKPVLGQWQFGVGVTPIMQSAFWLPKVNDAKNAGDLSAQQTALYAIDVSAEPTTGPFKFSQRTPGSFIELVKNENYFFTGVTVTEYVNGAYREAKAGVYDFSAYGTSTGPKLLEFDIGPFFDSVRYTIFSQSAAIQALKDGNIDFILTPFTFPINQVENQPNVAVIQNSTNAFRYLGFNVRKQPMASTTFRQAVATLIDREYLVEELFPPLGTSNAEPMYGFVPVGNGFWHNASTTQIGKGLNLSQRVANALQLLKGGGFTFGTEPVISADGTSFQTTGSGLKMPDGNPVPEMEIIGPDATWDPLRAAANPWIVGRLNEFGIPATSTLTSFNNVVAALFSETVAQDMDMWMLGWGLGLFPDYLENFFHSRHIPENQVGFNWGGYSNSTIDSLGDSLIADTDVSSARNTAFQLQEILADDLPYVPLFIPPVVEAYRSDRIVYPYTQVLGGLAGAHRPQGSLGLAAVVKPKSAAITPVPSVTPWALVGLALLLLLLTLSGRARRAIGRRTDG